jgi:predicted enzyme related to lactoylglutathione lyase
MPVVGMGGYFFRAKDPATLKAWYRDHLGVGGGCGTDESGQSNQWVWFTQGGPMVFEPFKESSDYFPAEKTAMVNLRVRDIHGLLAGLRAAGIDVITKEEWDSMGIGRFARIHDPEGNPIELWEPAAVAGEGA